MVKVSFDQKPYRKVSWIHSAPKIIAIDSNNRIGKMMLEKDPNLSGSLGTAISKPSKSCKKHQLPLCFRLGPLIRFSCIHR
jgi:predicted alternative tryptophan synthase beta-subunit